MAHDGAYLCSVVKNTLKITPIMTAIHRTDLLQVTAQTCGTVLLTLTMSGVSTLSDVFRQVRSSAPAETGIVTVKLRNRTQGWTQQHNLVFRQGQRESSKTKPASGDSYPSLFA